MQKLRGTMARRVGLAMAMALVLPGAMCASKDPASMDRKEIAKMVLQEGAMEVFKGKATGSIVSALAATPEGALNLLKADLRVRRDELIDAENRAAIDGDQRREAQIAREVDWVSANLDCIASGGKNCAELQRLMAQRKAAQAAAAAVTGEGGEGHSD